MATELVNIIRYSLTGTMMVDKELMTRPRRRADDDADEKYLLEQ